MMHITISIAFPSRSLPGPQALCFVQVETVVPSKSRWAPRSVRIGIQVEHHAVITNIYIYDYDYVYM